MKNDLSKSDYIYHQKGGGWHCSWCFRPGEFQTKLKDAVCGDGIRMGDFDWSVDLIKNLIAKGIWFGAHEPPSVPKVPRQLTKKNVPEYAFEHRNDKFKYLFHAQQPPETSKEKEIVMPYCSCKGEKKKSIDKIMKSLGPIDKGSLIQLQRSWCKPC